MHNIILQKSAPPPLKRPAPAPYSHPLLLIFQIPPSPLGKVIKIYFPPLKNIGWGRGGGSELWGLFIVAGLMQHHFHAVFFAEFSFHLGKITGNEQVKQWYHSNIYINSSLAHTKYLKFSLVRDHHQISFLISSKFKQISKLLFPLKLSESIW